MEEVAKGDHVSIIIHYAKFREFTAKIKEAREALDEMEMRLSREYVPDVMELNNIRTTTIEGVGRVSITHRWSCSMLDKQAGIEWLRDNDAASLIQETVNSMTLASFAKSKVEDEGKDLPDDIFKVSTMRYTSITKA